jgi:hypothetical protein
MPYNPRSSVFRQATPTPPRKRTRNKEGLPSGYPGAKLARKAIAGEVTVRHRGMRANGVTA